jgi:hypothetical protein
VAATLEHRYTYAAPSACADARLELATSGGTAPFFSGWIERPAARAAAMLVVARVARARYDHPDLWWNMDPVVSCEREAVRFEALSSCAGVYGRLDLDVADLDGEVARPGTTNVDFNTGMRAQLAKVGDASPLHMEVGAESVTVTSERGAVVERKVALPVRWVKGFGEVGVAQSRLEPQLELSGPVAARFVRALPKGSLAVYRVSQAGRDAWIGLSPKPGSFALAGPERLRLLVPVLRHARRLRAWGDESGVSAWVLDLPGARLHLVLSPDAFRGFSGEGQVLDGLAGGAPALAARGVAGYDVAGGEFFTRELPYDLARVEDVHPRLVGARRLIDAGAVRRGEPGEAWVRGSGGVEQRVRLADSACTCTWWARHAGARGPCKHVLAARMALEGDDG